MQRLITDSRKNLSFTEYYYNWVSLYLGGYPRQDVTAACDFLDRLKGKPPSPLSETGQGEATVVRT